MNSNSQMLFILSINTLGAQDFSKNPQLINNRHDKFGRYTASIIEKTAREELHADQAPLKIKCQFSYFWDCHPVNINASKATHNFNESLPEAATRQVLNEASKNIAAKAEIFQRRKNMQQEFRTQHDITNRILQLEEEAKTLKLKLVELGQF